MKKILLVTFLAIAAAGCNLQKEYVKADRLTYEAIAPEYEAYVAADPKLSIEQKERHLRTVLSWKLRIDKAEKE